MNERQGPLNRREYLEAIVESSDPRVRPVDRLKALELLHDLGGSEENCSQCAMQADISDEEVDDFFVAWVLAVQDADGFDAELSPRAAATLTETFKRLVEETAARNRA